MRPRTYVVHAISGKKAGYLKQDRSSTLVVKCQKADVVMMTSHEPMHSVGMHTKNTGIKEVLLILSSFTLHSSQSHTNSNNHEGRSKENDCSMWLPCLRSGRLCAHLQLCSMQADCICPQLLQGRIWSQKLG